MSEEVYTVEQFAERLKLHPKTVLRFIRDGRLRAVKLGKSYRILRSDFDAFAGVTPKARAASARVTAIVDLTDISQDQAQRLARVLPSARMGQQTPRDPMSIDVVHDPQRGQVKVVLIGDLGDVASMLRMVETLT
jgi:excisionase family DNA binding protein